MEDPRIDGETPRRLYNPYHDLNLPHHHRTPISIPTVPEFLFQEEARVQRRSWGENLTYYTGVGYLAGSAAGAALGLRSGLSAAEPGDTAKLRVNRVLNSCGAAGRRHGNRIGVLGLLYAGLESGMVQARNADDWVNSVVAGLGTGALFCAAGGARSAAVAGAIGGITAGAAIVGKQFVKRYIPI